MPKDESVRMSREDMVELAEEVTKNLLVRMGHDTTDPMEAQKDAQFLRKLRVTHEAVTKRKTMLLLTVIFSASVALFTMGISVWIKSLIHGTTP